VSRKPEEPAAGEDREAFAARWSRLKQDARQAPPPAEKKPADPEAPAPELPPVDKLTIDSDFRAFFHPKVEEGVRRAALKKLFNDPRFNIMDGLDTYIDDYSKSEPIPPAMLAGMKTAQDILRWAREDKEELAKQEALKLKEAQAQALEPAAAESAPAAEVRPEVPDAAPVPLDDTGTPVKSK
jgi:hypothetical protein